MHFLFLLSLLFQTSHHTFQPGNYKATSGSFNYKAVWFLEGKRHIRTGTTLNLQPDHTFQFSTCGCRSEGSWLNRNDTIFLKELGATFKPTTQISAARKTCNTSNFRISGNRLFRIRYDESKVVECLEFSSN